MVFNIYNPDGSKAFSIENTDAIRSEESNELSLESLYESAENSYAECTKYINAVEVMSAEGFGENAKAVISKVIKNIKEFLLKVCNFIGNVIQKCAVFFKNVWNKLTGTDKLLESAKHLGEINDKSKTITLSPLMYKLLFEKSEAIVDMNSFIKESAKLNSECYEIYGKISTILKTILSTAKNDWLLDSFHHISTEREFLDDAVERVCNGIVAELKFARQLFLNEDYVNGDNNTVSINELIKHLRGLNIDVSSIEKNIETSNKVLTTYSAECVKLLSQVSADIDKILSFDKNGPNVSTRTKEKMIFVKKLMASVANNLQRMTKTVNDELVYSTKLLNEIRKCCSQISKYNETMNN